MTKRMWEFTRAMFCAAAAVLLVGVLGGVARADETVNIGGSNAVLLRPKAPHGSVILMPGGNGAIAAGPNGQINALINNKLVRSRYSYLARGYAVLVVDAGTDLTSAVNYMAAIKRPVTVVATSRGTVRAAEGIARGARPDKLVLTSGLLTNESGSNQNVAAILGSAAALPPTVVIHHRRDACRVTQPAGVDSFARWPRSRQRQMGRRRHQHRRPVPGGRPSRLQRRRFSVVSLATGGGRRSSHK